jgi:hypothetical protein
MGSLEENIRGGNKKNSFRQWHTIIGTCKYDDAKIPCTSK